MNKFDIGDVKKVQEAFPINLLNIRKIRADQQTRVYSANADDNKIYTIRVIFYQKQRKAIIKETIDADLIPYIKSEIELLKQSDNMNIIHLIDHQESKEAIFLLQDFYLCTLTEIIQKYFPQKMLPLDLTIIILRQMVNGITYLHQNEIIHRDIKPDMISIVLNQEQQEQLQKGNINILNQALYKFNSLGFAKKVSQYGKAETYIGTELYMAPEIQEDKEYGYEVDMYSLGVCLFYLITGKYPFKAFEQRNQSQLLIEKQSENADFNLIQDVEMRNLIRQMLKHNPNQRLSWRDLADHHFIKINNNGQAGKLDIQLNQNIQIYKSPIQSTNSSIQSVRESRIKIQEIKVIKNDQITNKQKDDELEQVYDSCLSKRNHYISIINSNQNFKKLQQMIQNTNLDLGIEQTYNNYINYTNKIANLRAIEVKRDICKLQNESYNGFKQLFQKDLDQYKLDLNQQDFKLELNEFNQSNNKMYRFTLATLQHGYFVDKTNKLTNKENPIICLLYLCLVQIAKQTLIPRDLELYQDYKQQELWLEKYSQEPDHMAKNVTDVLQEHKIIY
ncbi:hypothetical protein pb186bvf_012725 [Paramecium bursaria]